MGTTSLVVEIVIIGFQTLLWLSLLGASVWDYKAIDLVSLKDWSAPIAVGLVGVSYTFGLIVDSIVGNLFAPWQARTVEDVRRWADRTAPEGVSLAASPAVQRAYVMTTSKDAFEQLDRVLNQSRLLRATSANLVLIGVASLAFVIARIQYSWLLLLGLLLLSLILSLVAIATWRKTLRGYYFQLDQVYRALVTRGPIGPKAGS